MVTFSTWPYVANDYMRLLVRKFLNDRCLTISSSLTYSTLLALVPLLSVALTLFSFVPAFESIIVSAQRYLIEVLTPNIENTVMQHLFSFVRRTRILNAIGVVALLFSSLLILITMDGALNQIWRVNRRRNTLKSLLAYFSVVVFGPLLLGISLMVTTYLATLPLFTSAIQGGTQHELLVSWLPLLITILAFTLLYRWVPNTRVPWWHALSGGLVAGFLFEMAKRGFILYVSWFPGYELIYGALAVIPLLLVWIYISWTIILAGAEVACCLGLFVPRLSSHYPIERFPLIYVYRLISHLWFYRGRGLGFHEILRLEPVAGEWLQGQLAHLELVGLIYMTDTGSWKLRQDPRVYTFYELFVVINRLPPTPESFTYLHGELNASTQELFSSYHLHASVIAGRPLVEFFDSATSSPLGHPQAAG